MDALMKVLEKKAQDVLDALGNVVPPDPPYGMSLMLVVFHSSERHIQGLSLNYDKEKRMWTVNFQNDILEIHDENQN